ncbi:hypothetical protein [Kitasatospora sp. NPDC059599]|uniref:hypothetical protein n=1 Tax=Kitasatospora sp. NPDC059599 TaxID=3346880 RepID=UPI00369FCBBA
MAEDNKVTEPAEDGKVTAPAKDKTRSGKYAGTEITIDGEEHLLLREDDVPVSTDDE